MSASEPPQGREAAAQRGEAERSAGPCQAGRASEARSEAEPSEGPTGGALPPAPVGALPTGAPPGAAAQQRGSLYLEVSAIAAERARVDCLVVPVFSDERPLRGSAGRADWRLCGRLSELAVAGKLSGRSGEALLMASFGGLAAPVVLVLGLGPRAAFDAPGLQAFAGEAVRRALGLRVAALAFPMPEGVAGAAGLFERGERVLLGAAEALASRGAGQPAELRLLLLVREDELPRAADILRTSRPARLPASVSLRAADLGNRPSLRGRSGLASEAARGADSIK